MSTGQQTNFDWYLEEQLKDPGFAERFDRASEAWDLALRTASWPEETAED